jgi:hypothetical protein
MRANGLLSSTLSARKGEREKTHPTGRFMGSTPEISFRKNLTPTQ